MKVSAMPLPSDTHGNRKRDRAGLLLMTNDQENCRKATKKCLIKAKHDRYSQLRTSFVTLNSVAFCVSQAIDLCQNSRHFKTFPQLCPNSRHYKTSGNDIWKFPTIPNNSRLRANPDYHDGDDNVDNVMMMTMMMTASDDDEENNGDDCS
jgi:hypothetical protein